MNIKLTAKETALMTAIGAHYFSFFDDGIVAGSGIWSNVMTDEMAGHKEYLVSATPKGVAGVASSLIKKQLLTTSGSTNPEGAWFELTELGADIANELAGNDDPSLEAVLTDDDPMNIEAQVNEAQAALAAQAKLYEGKLFGFDPSGRVTCFAHLGTSAQSAIMEAPNKKSWSTYWGTCYKMTAADTKESHCENCPGYKEWNDKLLADELAGIAAETTKAHSNEVTPAPAPKKASKAPLKASKGKARISHADHDHPATAVARQKCRDELAKAEAENIHETE